MKFQNKKNLAMSHFIQLAGTETAADTQIIDKYHKFNPLGMRVENSRRVNSWVKGKTREIAVNLYIQCDPVTHTKRLCDFSIFCFVLARSLTAHAVPNLKNYTNNRIQ